MAIFSPPKPPSSRPSYKHSEPQTTTLTINMKDVAITIIADGGDIILLIGEGKHGVQVSSQVLSCASNVFKAMFSRKFKEGSELASSTSPLVVPMPDDSYEPMSTLCNLLHHRVDDVPKTDEISIKLVAGVAKLCDKYACMKALSFVSKVWLKELVPHAGKYGCQVIIVAYLLDDRTAFSNACREYMMDHTASEFEEERRVVDPDGQLPERFWGMMESKSHAAYEVLQNALQKDMERLCEGETACHFSAPHGYNSQLYGGYTQALVGMAAMPAPQYHCGTHDAVQLSEYIRFLNQHDLWPFKVCRAQVLRKICLAMTSSPLTSSPMSRGERNRECRACATPIAAVLRAIAEKISKELDGVCLRCVRSGEEHTKHL